MAKEDITSSNTHCRSQRREWPDRAAKRQVALVMGRICGCHWPFASTEVGSIPRVARPESIGCRRHRMIHTQYSFLERLPRFIPSGQPIGGLRDSDRDSR